MNWTLKGREVKHIKDFPEGAIGFIYMLHFSNGKKYIGRKSMYSYTKRNFTKKELALITDKRLKTYEIVQKEVRWQTYAGSSGREMKGSMDDGAHLVKKEILKVCFTKKQITYYESQCLFSYGVLESDDFYNDNILGKFYRRDLDYDKEILLE
jgi:hypothetical protein